MSSAGDSFSCPGMLNSGLQPLWLKTEKPEIFSRVKHILHFPQYLSYILTGKIYAEHTSIGCHTALWDFDNMCYHPWVEAQGLKVPQPFLSILLTRLFSMERKCRSALGSMIVRLHCTIFACRDKFLLLSTGTWCINMNPFNTEKLTAEQLDKVVSVI